MVLSQAQVIDPAGRHSAHLGSWFHELLQKGSQIAIVSVQAGSHPLDHLLTLKLCKTRFFSSQFQDLPIFADAPSVNGVPLLVPAHPILDAE